MQRRAVALYFAFFVVVAGAAYGLIQTTSAPEVSMNGQTYVAGDAVTFGDRTYSVSSVSGSGGELTWQNESGVITTSIDNGSTVPPTDVVWEGQTARNVTTFADGSTVAYNDSTSEVDVNASAGSVTLTNVDDATRNTTVETGGTFEYRGLEATVTAVSDDEATVVWGNSYLVAVHNANVTGRNVTDPTEVTLVEQRNLTRLAVEDPALYDEVNPLNGTRKVTFRANDTNVPALEYFGQPERHTVAEGDTLVYQGNETTVAEVTNESVTLSRPGVTTVTVDLGEGENVTVGGQQYFAHFPDNSSVMILPTDERYDEYHAQEVRAEDYHERMIGLWGIVDLSLVAAILLLGTAFLPVRG